MTKVVSLVDTIRWTNSDGSISDFDDAKGETFDVPDSEAERLVKADAAAKGGKKKGDSAGSVGDLTVAKLDALAEEHGVEDYPANGKKADKVAALEAAGVEPSSE